MFIVDAPKIEQNAIILCCTDSCWYLSYDGEDTQSCGQALSSACKTFEWVLNRFHETQYRKNKTLCLFTDSNLRVDKQLVVSE